MQNIILHITFSDIFPKKKNSVIFKKIQSTSEGYVACFLNALVYQSTIK